MNSPQSQLNRNELLLNWPSHKPLAKEAHTASDDLLKGRPSVSGSVEGPEPRRRHCRSAALLDTTTPLWDLKQAAEYLGVSESWVRRHLSELPHSRHGRLIRFDPDTLRTTLEHGKPLKSERINVNPRRYQRGSINWKKTKKGKVAYGIYRVDVQTINGVERKQKKVRLGTMKELPTEAQARKRLDSVIAASEAEPPEPQKMTFGELAERWKLFAGPITPKPTFDTYLRNLQWVLSHWKDRNIQSITRHDIQLFLNAQAKDYSRSSIRGMQTVLQIILGYAYEEKLISTYPCVKIKCPLVTNTKRCVKRAELNEQQKLAIVARMKEPYATLTLLFARTPVRVEDAAGIKIADLDGHVWTIRRYVVEGEVYDYPPHEQRQIPIMDAELLARLWKLGAGREWVFRSRNGTPINTCNARKRFLKPVAKELGIEICGWHDFRHSLNREMRRNGVDPKVRSGALGHKKVNLAMDVYDRCSLEDLEQALGSTVTQLLPSCDPDVSVQ